MKATHEHHSMSNSLLPFIFHTHTKAYTNWHYNPEFLYCISGSGKVYIDDEAIEFSQGDTIVVNSNCLHSISPDAGLIYRCLIVDNVFFEQNGMSLDAIRFIPRIHDENAGKLIETIAEHFSMISDKYYAAALRKYILDYLLFMCKTYSQPAEQTHILFKNSEAIKAAVEYINKNFTERITLEDIAQKVGFSKYHFARMLKESTGYTLVDQINARRCDYAKQLLRDSTKTVFEICALCGFENASYFSKTFKSHTGLLPSQYRKKQGH